MVKPLKQNYGSIVPYNRLELAILLHEPSADRHQIFRSTLSSLSPRKGL